MSGQELVDELRAFIPSMSDMGTLNRAADRIEALEAELDRLRVLWDTSGKNDLIARAERAEQERDHARRVIERIRSWRARNGLGYELDLLLSSYDTKLTQNGDTHA